MDFPSAALIVMLFLVCCYNPKFILGKLRLGKEEEKNWDWEDWLIFLVLISKIGSYMILRCFQENTWCPQSEAFLVQKKFVSYNKAVFSKHMNIVFVKADNLGQPPQAWLVHASYTNIPCCILTAWLEITGFL